MRVSVCVGNYAKTPYCVPGLGVEVCCMEELCYCMRENAFLLDLSILEDGLLEWIERECSLGELAGALHPMVHKQGSLSMFVMAILRYVGLFDEETLMETERAIKRGAGLSGMEKRKRQIDYLLEKKRYKAAVQGYEELLERWQESSGASQPELAGGQDFLAKIWHNKGVAWAGLMQYGQAAECFLQAYELYGDGEECAAYLAAKRMELSEEDYVAFAGEQGEWYLYTLEVEKRLEKALGEWERQPDYLRLYNRRELRGRDRGRFYEDSERLTLALKDSYRRGL